MRVRPVWEAVMSFTPRNCRWGAAALTETLLGGIHSRVLIVTQSTLVEYFLCAKYCSKCFAISIHFLQIKYIQVYTYNMKYWFIKYYCTSALRKASISCFKFLGSYYDFAQQSVITGVNLPIGSMLSNQSETVHSIMYFN